MRQAELLAAQQDGEWVRAAAAGAASVALAQQSMGLGDDFPHLWPPAVLASIDAGLLDQAEQQIAIVAESPAGLVSPVLRAQLLRLQGALAARRGEDPEPLLRAAVGALEEYGAVPDRARTQQALGAWLAAQGRSHEAGPLLAAARATYEALGAAAWLAELDGLRPLPAAAP